MSNRLLDQAWKAKCGTIAQKAVLVRLADFAGPDGRCWPSQNTVALDIGLSDRAVRSAIGALSAAGHLTIETEAGRADLGASRFRYRIHPRTPEPGSGVAEEAASGVNIDTGTGFPCGTGKRRHPHRKFTTPTPENGAPPIYGTHKNPQEPLQQPSSTTASGFALEAESVEPQTPAVERMRDVIFEEVAKLHGGHVGITKSKRGKVNVAIRDIKESCKATGTPLTIAEVRKRIEHLHQKFPDLPSSWTATCLSDNWHELATPPQPKVNGQARPGGELAEVEAELRKLERDCRESNLEAQRPENQRRLQELRERLSKLRGAATR